MSHRSAVTTFLVLAMYGAATGQAQGAEADGTWLTQAGDARVKISKCGGGGICGVIVWLKEPYDTATGKPATDSKNRIPALAKRPIIGIPLFSACGPRGKANGQVRSTMPMMAAPMRAASP